jgi:hypothetical protein
MINDSSICLYHNGNSRVVDYYKEKFSNLKFSGNWSEATEKSSTGQLWEICFADATRNNMLAACQQQINIIRHISTYDDDTKNKLPEAGEFDYQDWLTHVVANNLSFADTVISDFYLQSHTNDEIAIVTTGRTANTHLQLVLHDRGQQSFEYKKLLDQRLLESKSALLLWRKDQWECLASTWIAMQTDYNYSHQLLGQSLVSIDFTVKEIDKQWINASWSNLCQSVLDHSMFIKYVCQKPIHLVTTENIVAQFQSKQQKINYNKEKIIDNYDQTMRYYSQSLVAELLELLYNKVQKHISVTNYLL